MRGSQMSPAERRRLTIAEWRRAQGERGANGVPEVLRALEFIARQEVANVLDGDPLRLRKQHLMIAQHRAISQQRKAEHGEPPADVELWWEQISAIAARWGIETKRSDWTKDKPKAPPADRMEAAE